MMSTTESEGTSSVESGMNTGTWVEDHLQMIWGLGVMTGGEVVAGVEIGKTHDAWMCLFDIVPSIL